MPASRLLFFWVLGAALGLAACAAEDEGDGSPSTTTATSAALPTASGPHYGFSFSPRTFGGDDFLPFFETATSAADVITWAGDWFELDKPTSAPYTITELGDDYGYEPLIIVGFFNQGARELIRPLDDATLDIYVALATDYARTHQPAYFSVGVEVDILYETSPLEFDRFVDLFSRTADAIHEVSPDTKVFTAFQLERLRGLRGGLFGGENDEAQATWELIDRFPTADLIGFTTYPSLIFDHPDDIPADYYTEILDHTTKPVAFVEAGWQAEDIASGWEGSEDEQVVFVERFIATATELDAELAIWSFLHDIPGFPPFESMGLIPTNGPPRAGWTTWQELVAPSG